MMWESIWHVGDSSAADQEAALCFAASSLLLDVCLAAPWGRGVMCCFPGAAATGWRCDPRHPFRRRRSSILRYQV